ncbi:MAG: VWA domain-containing protein [Planctomycetota bacterium]|nr:MAG: VWA domain-containing protein [Planctomycetota bacterium]
MHAWFERLPISFASPAYLSLLLLLPLVWWLSRRSLAGLEPGRRRLALLLRSLVVLLLVLAAAEIEWRGLSERVEVVFVLDHSRSVPDPLAAKALQAIDRSRERLDPRREAGKVVAFARDALNEATLRPDGPPLRRVASDLDRNHTNIQAGLERALYSFDKKARGRILLFSDGNQTAGDAQEAVAKARAQGVPVDVVPLEYAYPDEVLVEKVLVPKEAKIGEPFHARVVVHAVQPAEVKLHLWREGEVLESRRVSLKPGPNVELFRVTLDRPGFFRLQAVVEPLDPRKDAIGQNNSAHNFVTTLGKARVLLVHDDADPRGEESTHLLEALGEAAIRVEPIPAADFPLEAGELQAYDAIILDDVSRDRFSQAQQRSIERAVADMGLGLVMIGGTRSFGAGEWRGSPVERALPVEMDIKQEEVIPDGALIQIMHSCEMADGNAMAIKVCKASVDSLSAKDTVGVLYYGPMGEQWQVPPTKASNKRAIKQKIHNMQIGDMPSFDPIFRMALTALKRVRASVKHMIIMSDGDPSPPAPALLKQCREEKITVSTICYFAHGGAQGPSVDVMKRIANITGGKYYYLEKADDLPRIFLKESQKVARSLIVNQTFVPQRQGKGPLLKGLDELPPVSGYVLTEAKPRAEVSLVSPEGAPVLATWTYGVGKSLAFTSDAKPRWGAHWVAWEGYRSFWSQAIRWVSKNVDDSLFTVKTQRVGDKGRIVLEAVDADGEFVDDLTVTARVRPPEGDDPPREVRLALRGAGRYEGEFPIDEVGTYTVSLVSTDSKGRSQASLTTGLVAPYSEEFRTLRSNRAFLEKLAKTSGGRVLALDDLIDWKANPWETESLRGKVALDERWPLLLTIALVLFLLDVCVRRVAIDWSKLVRRAIAAARPSEDAPRTLERLQARKQRVQRERSESLAKFQAEEAAPAPRAAVAGETKPTSEDSSADGARARAAEASAEEPADPDQYTNRLLRAKRRARKSLEEPDPDEE